MTVLKEGRVANFIMAVKNGKNRIEPKHGDASTERGTKVGTEGLFKCCKCGFLLPADSFRLSSLYSWVGNEKIAKKYGQAARHPCLGCQVSPVTEARWTADTPSLNKERKPFPPETKTVYLDIETAGISRAEYNIVLSYALKVPGQEPMCESISIDDLNGDIDVDDPVRRADFNLLTRLMEKLKDYNRVVTWYGKGFDIPMLRTRCMILGIPFPQQWQFVHTDQYYLARNKFKFTRNRMAEVAKSLGCPFEGTKVTPKAWDLAARGYESGLKYVREHNKLDVRMLEFVDEKFKDQSVPVRSAL